MADESTAQGQGTTQSASNGGTTQAAAAAQPGSDGGRTYTQAEVDELLGGYVEQAEVNRLVGEARRKARAKFEGYDEYKAAAEAHADYDEVVAARDKATAEADSLRAQVERLNLVAKVHEATGVPASLLKGDTEEELTASAEAVRAYAGAQAASRPQGYPQDKGGGANPSPMTREQILGERDTRKRQRLIAENISLFQ